jgi:hypothetical protein
MKPSLILIAFLSLGIIVQVAALAPQNVGGILGNRGSNCIEHISMPQKHISMPQKARIIYGVGGTLQKETISALSFFQIHSLK